MAFELDRRIIVYWARILLVLYLAVFVYLLWTPAPPRPPGRLDLVGHVLLYAGLGIGLGWALGTRPAIERVRWVLATGLVMGALGEWVQGYIPGRTPDAADLAANWMGVIGATLFVSLWPRELVRVDVPKVDETSSPN